MVVSSNIDMMDLNQEILEDNYSVLLNVIKKTKVSSEKINEIKEIFKESISSPRVIENINSLEELMNVLEKRCTISYDNIIQLYHIAEQLEGGQQKVLLGKLLVRQSHWLSKSPPLLTKLDFIEDAAYSYLDEFSLPERVSDYISSAITRYGNFARALRIIHEKDIDLIDELNDNNKTRKCLEIYIREAHSQRLSNPYETLLQALEVIGRRDVKEKVEGMLLPLKIKNSIQLK